MDLSSFALGSSALYSGLRQDRDPEPVLIGAEEFKEVGSVPRSLNSFSSFLYIGATISLDQ